MVVLGNPPYSGHSANKGLWISNLLRGKDTRNDSETGNYFEVDGKPLGEKNPKWLNDDYVKFIRFAQWRIEQTGYGILAFINNNGYLDNPTFRGMRQSLLQSFNEIFILDLHGSSRKKEITPDGEKDENVFDITQGVSIIFLVKHLEAMSCKVNHAGLWGLRENKYVALTESDLRTTTWKQLQPAGPDYFFVPRDNALASEYKNGYSLNELFDTTSVAVVTSRDELVIDFDEEQLKRRIGDVLARDSDIRGLVEQYPLNESKHWSLERARSEISAGRTPGPVFTTCVYKPFDFRPFAYCPALLERPRYETMRNLLQENCGLLYTRTISPRHSFSHVFAVTSIPIGRTFPDLAAITYLAPLYVYPEGHPDQGTLHHGRRSNFSEPFTARLTSLLVLQWVDKSTGDLKHTVGPENAFHYCYAILNSPEYRRRYAEFLKLDFPRIPLTSDRELFRRLCELGGDLVSLHLLESPRLAKPITRFDIEGNCEVGKGFPKYLAPGSPEPGTGKPLSKGRVYISSSSAGKLDGQYFDNVPPEVWEFHIGGYQVCEKWLKDRRERTLTHDDIEHYQKVVMALAETIRLMQEIDAAIPKWPIE